MDKVKEDLSIIIIIRNVVRTSLTVLCNGMVDLIVCLTVIGIVALFSTPGKIVLDEQIHISCFIVSWWFNIHYEWQIHPSVIYIPVQFKYFHPSLIYIPVEIKNRNWIETLAMFLCCLKYELLFLCKATPVEELEFLSKKYPAVTNHTGVVCRNVHRLSWTDKTFSDLLIQSLSRMLNCSRGPTFMGDRTEALWDRHCLI